MRVRLLIDVEMVRDVITPLGEVVAVQPVVTVQIPDWDLIHGRLMGATPVEGAE